jgi:positive regulator of sigma E activity
MSQTGIKLGVAAGMLTTVIVVFPLFKLFLGGCFFEQGCGEYEGMMVLGVILASCAMGGGAAYAVARLFTKFAGRRHE